MEQRAIVERLKKHPHLFARVESILDIAESNTSGPDTADAVEERAIVELRKLGQDVMREWAEQKAYKEIALQKEQHPKANYFKKK